MPRKTQRDRTVFYVRRETAEKARFCGISPKPVTLDEEGYASARDDLTVCYAWLRPVVGRLKLGQQVRARFRAEVIDLDEEVSSGD